MALTEWLGRAESWVNSFAVKPLLILFLGIFAAKLAQDIIVFIGRRIGSPYEQVRLAGWIVFWTSSTAVVAWSLASINLLGAVLWVLGGAVAVVCLLSLLLSARDFIPNVASHRAVREVLRPGAQCKTSLAEGTVVSVQLGDTHIRTADGDHLFVPNSTMLQLLQENKKKN
jgi:hypothetical protein